MKGKSQGWPRLLPARPSVWGGLAVFDGLVHSPSFRPVWRLTFQEIWKKEFSSPGGTTPITARTWSMLPVGRDEGRRRRCPEPKLWFHDILRADGTPFKAREVESIKVTTGKLPPRALPQRKVLVATAEHAPVPWRYTLKKPADGCFKPDFNDSAWKQGTAPFGTLEPPFARKPNTSWTSADLWLRREFEMPAGQFMDLALLLHHDEDTEVYINGVMAVNADGYNAAYESFDISPEAQAALKPGRNIFAAHCRQTIGGQYFDLGIEGVAAEASVGKGTSKDHDARAPSPDEMKAH